MSKYKSIHTGAVIDQAVTDVSFIADKFPNNAGAHNSIFRGKFLGNTYTSEQKAAIDAGTFEDLYIGDYWTMAGVNYRIAAFNYYYNTGDVALTDNHATIIPDTILYDHEMNDTDITIGAYAGSKMRTEGLDSAKTVIEAAFGAANVLTHRNFLHNAVTSGYTSGGAWYDAKVELMTELNVYGAKMYSNATQGTNIANNIFVDKTQFPIFALNPQSINIRANYWLRDVASASAFALVDLSGHASIPGASFVSGVRPAFSIS